LPPLAGELSVAQWPLYIDRAKGGHRPTLEAFEKRFDVKVDYKEIISDNQEFFAKVVPYFKRNQPSGWDLIALSDWVVGLMNEVGWIEKLDYGHLPHVSSSLLPAFSQGFPITRFEDLWDDRLTGHVGMLTEMVDTMSLTMLMQGVEPADATLDDAKRAQEKLIEQRDAGIVRGYHGQGYTDSMVSGDTWATMAWSGDVFYYEYLGGAPDLEFVTDAHAFMDWYYRPDIAVQVTDWVLHMTPVDGVQDLMVKKAEH
jgi:spermidine/putrescine transport system substrate-binding protein